MNPATRRTLFFAVVVLVLASLVFRRGAYAFESIALELRYFWWLVLILGGGLWLLLSLGKPGK
jgi:hypothetical protein